jgi:hypothetical protein
VSDRLLMNEFSKKALISHFMKICSVGAKLFHFDRRTDITKLSHFLLFENMPKKMKQR